MATLRYFTLILINIFLSISMQAEYLTDIGFSQRQFFNVSSPIMDVGDLFLLMNYHHIMDGGTVNIEDILKKHLKTTISPPYMISTRHIFGRNSATKRENPFVKSTPSQRSSHNQHPEGPDRKLRKGSHSTSTNEICVNAFQQFKHPDKNLTRGPKSGPATSEGTKYIGQNMNIKQGPSTFEKTNMKNNSEFEIIHYPPEHGCNNDTRSRGYHIEKHDASACMETQPVIKTKLQTFYQHLPKNGVIPVPGLPIGQTIENFDAFWGDKEQFTNKTESVTSQHPAGVRHEDSVSVGYNCDRGGISRVSSDKCQHSGRYDLSLIDSTDKCEHSGRYDLSFMVRKSTEKHISADQDVCAMEDTISTLVKAQNCFNELPGGSHNEVQQPRDQTQSTDQHNAEGSGTATTEAQKMVLQLIQTKIKQIVKFSKSISGFSDLSLHDQLVLVKASKSESQMLGSKVINPKERSFQISADKKMSYADIRNLFPKEYLEQTLLISTKLSALNLTQKEMAVLRAIIITYPDRVGLENQEAVQKIYGHMTNCLLHVLNQNNCPDIQGRARQIDHVLRCMRESSETYNHVREDFFEKSNMLKNFGLIKEFMDM